MWIILTSCIAGIILMIVIIVILIKDPDKKVETSVVDEKLEESKKDLYDKLQHQKKYLKHLDEKHVQNVIEDEEYHVELKAVMKSINEIIDEMDYLGLFDSNDQKEEHE